MNIWVLSFLIMMPVVCFAPDNDAKQEDREESLEAFAFRLAGGEKGMQRIYRYFYDKRELAPTTKKPSQKNTRSLGIQKTPLKKKTKKREVLEEKIKCSDAALVWLLQAQEKRALPERACNNKNK